MKMKDIFTIGFFGWVAFTGCDDRFETMNSDPLALTEIADDFLFTTAVHQTFGNNFYLKLFELQFASQYAHVYVTNTEMRQADLYQSFHIQDVYDEMFAAVYGGPLRHIEEVLRLTKEGEGKNDVRHALARIVACVSYERLTDCYGDIPYFNGAKGNQDILTPAYDAQAAIYKDMLEQLGQCVEVLKTADPKQAYPGSDPVYNNQLDKWAKFANSLRLRLAMRMRFVDAASAHPVIKQCLGLPLIEENEDNFQLLRQESDNSELYNPWYNLKQYNDFKMSQFFVETLRAADDPRLPVLVKENEKGEFKGFINGLIDQALGGYVWDDHSAPMPVLVGKATPSYIMTAAEVWFLRAEAALFQLGENRAANTCYQSGIISNMEMWQVAGDEQNDFLSNSPMGSLQGSTEEQFEQIGTQAWIAFVPNFTEAWFNIRRTGYPVIARRTAPDLSQGVTNGYLPKRFLYTTSEYNRNRTNVEAAVARQGTDVIDTPVWWDVRD